MKNGVPPMFQNSEKAWLSRSGFGWDSRLADFDNDGVLEAMQACGFIKGKINRWPNYRHSAQATIRSCTTRVSGPASDPGRI